MNPVDGVTWAFTAGILGLFTWLGWLDLRDRRQKRHDRLRDALRAEAELYEAQARALRIVGPCADPPCSDEDWWICDNHLPRGKHHPPPLRYGPEPIVGRCEWSDDMERRFAE